MPKETNIWEQVRKLQCGILFLRRIERSSQFEFEILIQLIHTTQDSKSNLILPINYFTDLRSNFRFNRYESRQFLRKSF